MAERPSPPRPSPRLALLPELDDEPKTNPRIKRSNHVTRLLSLGVAGGFSLLTLGSVAIAYEKLRDVAKDAGVDGAKLVVGDVDETKRAVRVIDADLQQHKADEARERQELKGDLHARGEEIRDLYKAVMEGKRSERLEKPLPPLDGGHP